MAGKNKNIRKLTSFKWEEGATRTIDVSGSRRVLHAIYVVISGSIDTTAAVVGDYAIGGNHNLIDRLEFRVAGYDPAVNAGRNDETRINLSGRYFGFDGDGGAGGQNLIPTMNILTPDKISLIEKGQPKGTPPRYGQQSANIAILGEDAVHVVYEIPFYISGGLSPRDFHLDMSNLDFANLRLTMGRISDLSRSGDNEGTAELEVTVIVEEMEFSELLQYRGNAEVPLGYYSVRERVIAITADNNALREDIQLAGNYLAQFLVSYDANNLTTDDIVQSVRLERENNTFYDIPSGFLRWLNWQQHNAFADTDSAAGSPLRKGLVMIEPARDQHAVQLSQTKYLGTNSGQAQLLLDVKKPSNGNGELVIISQEAFVTASMEAVTRELKDMPPAVRSIANEKRAVLNERAKLVEDAARAQGYNR